MNINIRPIRPEDAQFLHEMRIMDGVRENIIALKSDRITKMQSLISGTKLLKNLDDVEVII